jgi:hypothetical protein
MDGPNIDTSGKSLSEEELIIRYLHEKSQAQAESSHRSWIAKDLDRLPGWLMKRKNLRKERLEVEFLGDFGHYRTSSAIRTACRKKRKADSRQKNVVHQLAPVDPAVLDTMPVSRSPNAIIDTPSLDSSHTMTAPSNDNTTPKHPLLERPRSPQLHHQLQVPDNAERLSRNSPPLLNEDEEAVAQSPLAVVASESASEQMVLSSSPENAEDTPTLGNRRHRVDITPKPPARFTAINGGNVHPAEPNISELTPQMETNKRDTLPGGRLSQRASKGKPVEQRRDDQNVSQKEGFQSKLPSNAVFALATWPFEAYQIYMCHRSFLPLSSFICPSFPH